jgi:hypothetical protein
MESLDYDDIKLADDPFEPITKVLDPLFQHEEEVELPERCQEFLEQFQRERQEQLQAYLVRHQTMLKKLKDLNVDVPPPLARWHLLMRAGIPRWIHPQVKRMCNVELTTEKVSRALARMFGADTTPNAKDGEVTTFKHDVHMVDYDPYDNVDDEALDETYYHDDDEVYYQCGKMIPMAMAMRMRSTTPTTTVEKKMFHLNWMKQLWQLKMPTSTTSTAARR